MKMFLNKDYIDDLKRAIFGLYDYDCICNDCVYSKTAIEMKLIYMVEQLQMKVKLPHLLPLQINDGLSLKNIK